MAIKYPVTHLRFVVLGILVEVVEIVVAVGQIACGGHQVLVGLDKA